MLDDGVRARKHQAGVTIVKVHQVRRLSPAAVHLDDLAGMLGLADDLAVYVEPVTDYRLHRLYLPSLRPRADAARLRLAAAAATPQTYPNSGPATRAAGEQAVGYAGDLYTL
jgi:hypothetical protein